MLQGACALLSSNHCKMVLVPVQIGHEDHAGFVEAGRGLKNMARQRAYGIDFPADLNGPQHLGGDYLKTSLPMDGQTALVPDSPGHGCDIDEDKVKGELRLEL